MSLAELNELRVKNNLKPLKSWKSSKDALTQAIAKLTPIDQHPMFKDTVIPKPEPPAPKDVIRYPAKLARGTETESHCRKAVADARRFKKRDRDAEKLSTKPARVVDKHHNLQQRPKEKPKAAQPVKSTGDTFTLADLAREMGVDPKKARAKARRIPDEVEKLQKGQTTGWNFPASARKRMMEVIG